jgi:hypothetical protein
MRVVHVLRPEVRLALGLLMLSAFAAPAAIAGAGAGQQTVCVAQPQVASDSGSDLSAPLRDGLVSTLAGSGLSAKPLNASSAEQALDQAKAEGCSELLTTALAQKHGGKFGSMLRKVAPLASALPMIGGHGDLASAAAVAQSAAGAMAQQEAMQASQAALASAVKSGDTITLEYRLTDLASGKLLKSDTLKAKAHGDGEDVLGPMIQQTGAVVAGVANGSAGPVKPGAPTGVSQCAQLASMPNAPMSVAACEQMMAAQKGYEQAANDPSARRPGDEQMSCEAITAELKSIRYATPDQQKLAKAQQSAADFQAGVAKRQTEMNAEYAKDQTALNAAIASDTATTLATGGQVNPQTASKLQQRQLAEMVQKGKQAAAEDAPKTQALLGSTTSLSADMSQQVAANPRLARLMQLAQSKNCQGE